MRTIIQIVFLLLAASAQAKGDLTGITVGVADGDTLTVLTGQDEVRVRLAEIDAPEKSQAFGKASKQSLAGLCYRKRTMVQVRDVDRYGRVVGHVVCGSIDANRTQLTNGMAWVYAGYAKDSSLYRLQDAARRAKRGLWSEPNPIAPWEWRRATR